jgi:hypothetical protein
MILTRMSPWPWKFLPEVDALVEYLDSYRPSLTADIENLTSLLSPLIEDQGLPDQRLNRPLICISHYGMISRGVQDRMAF